MPTSKIINGIDIGSSKITTIIGQYYSDEDRLNIIAAASTPAAGFRKAQIIDLDQAAKTLITSIESAERMAGFQIKQAGVAISAPYLESLNSTGTIATNNPNAEIGPDDIDRAIEASKATPIPDDKEILHAIPRIFSLDNQNGIIDPRGMSGVRLEIQTHLILATTSALKNLHKILDEAGINPTGIIYSGLTAAEGTLTPTEKELGVALVDIGGTTTNLTVYQENSPLYSAVLPVGANNITNDLAIGFRLSLEDTEKIKLKLSQIAENKKFEDEIDLSDFGLSENSIKKISFQTAVNGIIKPRLEEIFQLIYQKINDQNLVNSIPAGIVLTGGGSLTLNIKEICNQIIPLPQRIAHPPKIGGVTDDITSPAYTSAIGLILYQAKNNFSANRQGKRKHPSLNNLFTKFKSVLEPLLP